MKTNLVFAIIATVGLIACEKKTKTTGCDCLQKHYKIEAQYNGQSTTFVDVWQYDSEETSQDCSNDGKRIDKTNSTFYVIECN